MRNYTFTPQPIPTIAFAIVFSLLLSLGFWQLTRFNEKKQLLQDYTENLALPAIPLRTLTKPPPAFTPLIISGHYDNKQQFLLINRYFERQVGYHVLSLFKLDNSEQALLINRGFIPRSLNPSELPDIELPEEKLTLLGFANYPSTKHFILGDNITNNEENPLRMQSVNLAEIETISGLSLYPFVLSLDSDAPFGFTREWQIVAGDPNKHLGYAIQWFIMALILLSIFIGLNFKKP